MSDSTDIQRYMNLSLDDLMQELVVCREVATGGVERGDLWRTLETVLRQRICDEWNWCERRQDARFDDPLNVALALVSLVAPDATRWQVPAALIAVILGVDRILDMCRTTLNVTGDITAATYVARSEGYELIGAPESEQI